MTYTACLCICLIRISSVRFTPRMLDMPEITDCLQQCCGTLQHTTRRKAQRPNSVNTGLARFWSVMTAVSQQGRGSNFRIIEAKQYDMKDMRMT